MRIAMVASEANPLAKSGGLADVVAALSVAYAKQGHEVIIVMPFFKSIAAKTQYEITRIGSFFVNLSWRHVEAEIYVTEINGVKYYLVGSPRTHRPLW